MEHESKGEERGERTKRVSRYHGSHVRRTYSNDNGFHFAVWSLFPTSQLAKYNCEVRARREVHTPQRSLHKIEQMVKKT